MMHGRKTSKTNHSIGTECNNLVALFLYQEISFFKHLLGGRLFAVLSSVIPDIKWNHILKQIPIYFSIHISIHLSRLFISIRL
jgi:hypothetical protein